MDHRSVLQFEALLALDFIPFPASPLDPVVKVDIYLFLGQPRSFSVSFVPSRSLTILQLYRLI